MNQQRPWWSRCRKRGNHQKTWKCERRNKPAASHDSHHSVHGGDYYKEPSVTHTVVPDMTPKRLIRRHNPLITPRIAFQLEQLPAPHFVCEVHWQSNGYRRTIDQDPNPQTCDPPVFLPIPTFNKGVRLRPNKDTGDNEGPITDDSESDLDLNDVVDPEDKGPSQHAVQRSSKIPKPPGEAGRPGSGGFNLEEALGWSKDYFTAVQVFLAQVKLKCTILMHLQKRTHDLVTQVLDNSRSYNKQSSYEVDRICKKVNTVLFLTKHNFYTIISA